MFTPTSETMTAQPADEASFLRAVRTTPIIDNHAHPLLRPAAAWTLPLLCITTEADGSALDATATSLPHLRAVKQLAQVLGCEPTWAAVSSVVEEKRKRKDEHEGWVRTCLAGIHSVLVDDKIGVRGDNEAFDYFDVFTPAAAKRIVRIEHVATELIEVACRDCSRDGEAFSSFVRSLRRAILEAWADPVVVGFKSAICYRTGLDVPRHPDQDKAFSAFCKIHRQRRQPGAAAFTRLDRDGLNQFLVHFLASVMSESPTRKPKPIQFHTGLGDNDITLTKASPAHLQPFIKQYPSVPIVLLHSGYPFVRDAGYLATVYENVYADIGEVFPMVSRDGEETIIRQILELCPSSKIIWSTDGHWFPETYLLAVMQMREAFETVLCGYVRRGDLTWQQATELVENVLFHNSNRLYDLSMTMDTPLSTPKTEPASPQAPLLLESASTVPQPTTASETLANLLSIDPSIQFIRVCWQDMTGTLRAQSMPLQRAQSLASSTNALELSVSQAAMGILQNDHLIERASATGEWNLCTDLRSLRSGPRSGHAMAMGDFKTKDNASPVALCPRTVLRNTVERAASRGITFLLGFEVEFMLLRRTSKGKYTFLDDESHAWCTFDALDHPAATVVERAVAKLASAGVHVETVHAESALGQYEIVLPATTPLEAIDTLIYARSIISSCAGPDYKMTLLPKPIPDAAGTAAHVHMSISSAGGSDPTVYEPFYAGILSRLRSLLAFTCPNPASYDRLVDGCWAGGTWIAWGTQNRETPLRKIEGSHWELKCVDGLANPYLAMAAILGAGLEGMRSGREMEWKECVEDPSSITAERREALGVRERLPSTLREALDALREDEVLKGVLGRELVDRYLGVKWGEIEALEELEKSGGSRWKWVVERY